MAISLRKLHAFRERHPESFEEDPWQPRTHDEIVMRRRRALWRRNLGWIGKHQWPARLVIVTAEFTIAYLALVFGMWLGLVIKFLM